jgi:hypothetical protein
MEISCLKYRCVTGKSFFYYAPVIVYLLIFTCVALLIEGASTFVWAAQVQAVVDRTTINFGESIELTVTVKESDGEVDVGKIGSFRVISSGSSSSFEFINGRSSRKMIYNYVLLPTRTGRLTIPALPVTIGRKTLYTRPITVNVQKRASQTQDSRDLFLKVKVSNQTPYVGEQISCTFTLYNTIEISDAQFRKPEFKGFGAKELENQNTRRTIINGREYILRELTYILIPQKSGLLTIEPAELHCNIVQRSNRHRIRSPFDDFFGRTHVEPRILHSEPLSLTAKQLPQLPQSKVFSGLVGQFKLKADIEKTEFSVGDSVTLTLTLEGSGNILDAPDLRPDTLDVFKQYHDSPQEKIQLTSTGYKGKKIFRTALVPVKAGNYLLPEVTLTYFDVKKETYQTITTNPMTLKVTSSGKDNFQTPRTHVIPKETKREVTFTGRDMLPLKEDLDALESQTTPSVTWFLLWISFPAAGFWGAQLILRILRKEESLKKRMVREARKMLKAAAKTDPKEKEFLSLLYRALVTTIRTKSNTIGESLTWSEAKTLLRQSGCNGEILNEATRLLEEIETENYRGGRFNLDGHRELLSRTQSMARRLLK